MKKIMFATLLVVLALVAFTGVAGAQTSQQYAGPLHEYMEKALAGKLGIDVTIIEAEFDAGKTLHQIAIDNGITQADLPAFMLEVRTDAINAALAAGAITQFQADKMLQSGGYGNGSGMRRGSNSLGSCNGAGTQLGFGMQRGGHWQQVNP